MPYFTKAFESWKGYLSILLVNGGMFTHFLLGETINRFYCLTPDD